MRGNPSPPEVPHRSASYRWNLYRRTGHRSAPPPVPQQPLDRYQWRTSAHLEPALPRFSPHHENQDQNQDQDQGRRRTFLRSVSEPGADRKSQRRTVSSFLSRISRTHRSRESGRKENLDPSEPL
ncbi:Autophagy-related protein 11 [Dissostichus eleginoides]|uniref:Autophagy-related protein 11 n=1 Tax=Dissostichus eleginoides TaxID=100907 RepID=A0AAD9EZB4_DISEL|nr:Autophagy-related protein 11 [Dissostichus eleginoides]